MDFSEIAALTEENSDFPLTEMRVVPEGVIAQLTATTPDGKAANATIYFNADKIGEEELMARLVTDASQALQRYLDSFVVGEPPQWDKMQWGP